MLGISIISSLVIQNRNCENILIFFQIFKGKITWNKPEELDSLDFGNPGPDRQDIEPSTAPIKNKLTSTITQLLKNHFDKKNNNENPKIIRRKVSGKNVTKEAILTNVKEGLTDEIANQDLSIEAVPLSTPMLPTDHQSEPLILNIKRPSYAPPASSYTTSTAAPTISYGNSTGYSGAPVVVCNNSMKLSMY